MQMTYRSMSPKLENYVAKIYSSTVVICALKLLKYKFPNFYA